ncbi:MAG: Rpn family recombination-promoting nuclease/putative transposase [Treponema sp.]|nr:Rpn family recombination-promoting nuclease/putative transposase [Treponema sp.]
MTKVQFNDTDDLIDICYDNVFKAVFTKETPESRGALSRLISALIGRNVSVATITANEPPIDSLRDRQIRFDIACLTDKEEPVNVEMSLNPTPVEPIRLEYHISKLFAGQDIRGSGKDYKDLKEAYQIAFLVKERFFTDEAFLHKFEYYDSGHGVSLGGRSRIITLELSKLDRVVEKPVGEMTAPEHWAVYFRYLLDLDKRRKINEILEYEEGIAMASEVLMNISRDQVERARLMSEFKYEVDTRTHINHAKQQAQKEIIDLLKSGKSPEEVIKEYEAKQ